ncbi:plasma protease C1 inhibitor isoform X2 [Heteronotia binoei]|uniref:plasma protease C1 inhibitor isoform X2 n=1 Tax=Heteronotia binoei TaxID=13085 RepID=UPI00292EF835|nr:plasma protease C1 inhibitor isoform X2 [Heteronotia binoei]
MKTWLIFIYLVPTVISIEWVTSDYNENNRSKNLRNPEEGLVEAITRNEETADLKAESNTASREEESESITKACQLARLPGNLLLECLNATEPSFEGAATTKPTIVPTTETTDSNPPRRCQPLSNPWSSCNESTVEDELKLAEALSEFAINFYTAAIQYEESDSNLVFSPFSISMMLSNLLLGAHGQTKEDLENLLSYPKEFTCVHDVMSTFRKSEAMKAASAIFAQPRLTWNSDFYQLSQKFYRTVLRSLTNDSASDVNEINDWVRRNTNYKIKKLLDQLDSDVQIVLVNAVYFHSKWKNIFRIKDTTKEKFYRPGLPPFKVFMMTSKKYPLAFFTDHTLQAKVGQLQLSHNMSLVIIMPRFLSQNLSDVEKRLSGDIFKSVMTKLEHIPFKPTVVTIPRFKVDSSLDLMSVVGEMAYGIFFDANLCGISESEELAVSSAQHRAVMEINEEGVEAAAATAISLARTANFFEVQQPFIFAVVNEKKFPIFMGRINNPQA